MLGGSTSAVEKRSVLAGLHANASAGSNSIWGFGRGSGVMVGFGGKNKVRVLSEFVEGERCSISMSANRV